MLKLPTDNLYKFAAIFGLALIALGSYAILKCWSESNIAITKWNAQTHVFVERASQDFDEARAAVQCAIDNAKAKPLTDICKSVNQRAADAALEGKRLALDLATLQGQEGVLDFLRRRYSVVVLNGIYLVVLGHIVSGVGFALWYFRVQRYQDEALKKSALPEGKDNEASAAELD